MLKLDKRLSKLAESFNAKYTRYADDITISGKYNIHNILEIVYKIIDEENFSINIEKTRIRYYYQRQEVTGLIVNSNKVNVSKKYIKKVKQEIYYCLKFGVSDHLMHNNINKRFYKDHLYGKVYYIYMVNHTLGSQLLKELERINWYG